MCVAVCVLWCRMRLRLETLKREQEQYLQDMERAIHKHEHIALRNNTNKAAAAPPAVRPLSNDAHASSLCHLYVISSYVSVCVCVFCHRLVAVVVRRVQGRSSATCHSGDA